MHTKGCPKGGRMKMTIETTSYPANPHRVLVRVIYDALGRSRRSGGMSKKSIQSQIEQIYRCKLGVRFERELTKSLKRMVRSQHLEKSGYRYKMLKTGPSSRGWRLHDALPLTCRCKKPCSRSSSRCPGSPRSCKPYGGIAMSSSKRRCGCKSRSGSPSRSRSRSRSTVRWRRRRVGTGSRKRKRVRRRRRKSRRTRGRTRSCSRYSSRSRSRSRAKSRARSRSRTRSLSRGRYVKRVDVIRSRASSRSRGRSPTRRTRTTSTSRSQTRSTSRSRRIRYHYQIRSRSASRSTNGTGGGRSPSLVVPVPKLDPKRGLFEPGLVPAINFASTSHSARGVSPGAASARGRRYSPSPSPARHHQYTSSSVPPPSSPTRLPYLPFLKPGKPALRQSAPQSPTGTDTLTPKSMMKFLTE